MAWDMTKIVVAIEATRLRVRIIYWINVATLMGVLAILFLK